MLMNNQHINCDEGMLHPPQPIEQLTQSHDEDLLCRRHWLCDGLFTQVYPGIVAAMPSPV